MILLLVNFAFTQIWFIAAITPYIEHKNFAIVFGNTINNTKRWLVINPSIASARLPNRLRVVAKYRIDLVSRVAHSLPVTGLQP